MSTEAQAEAPPAAGARRASRPLGRPRDDAFDGRILQEGFEELARNGISHFSVSAVARRAGVAKGSIYLRWPTREELILDSSLLLVREITPPPPGPLRDRLLALSDHWAAVFAQPRAIEVLLRVDADRDKHPDLFRTIFARVQEAGNRIVAATVREAQAAGEIPAGADAAVVTRVFVGAMFVEALAHTPAGQVRLAFRRDLVDFIVARWE